MILKSAGGWDELQKKYFRSGNRGQNLLNNVKKLSKTGHDKKTFKFVFP